MKTTDIPLQELSDLLLKSNATDTFKKAVQALVQGDSQAQIAYNPGAPPVKVLRFIQKLLEERPEHPIESVKLSASSGCSNFTGSAVVQPGNIQVNFNWDCAWRARERGWTDFYGDADQIRAARTLGYQCFEKFEIKP